MRDVKMSYKQKNDVRNWYINRLVERLLEMGIPLWEAVIFYLAGPEANDVKALVDKGFNPANLYGFEDDEKNLICARRLHANVIGQKISNGLLAWPEGKRVNGIIADFNCGLDQSVIGLAVALNIAPCVGPWTVIVGNFLKGREKIDMQDRFDASCRAVESPFEKHRGAAFLALVISAPCMRWAGAASGIWDHESWRQIPKKQRDLYCSTALERSKPLFNQYRTQKKHKMQSVVFTYFRKNISRYKLGGTGVSKRAVKDLKNECRAARAVGTMRRNGALPCHGMS